MKMNMGSSSDVIKIFSKIDKIKKRSRLFFLFFFFSSSFNFVVCGRPIGASAVGCSVLLYLQCSVDARVIKWEVLRWLETLSISRKVLPISVLGGIWRLHLPPCRLLSPVFLVGSQSPKRRWGWGKRSMDPLKPNKNLFFLWTKTSNKSVKHNHQSTRPLYKIIRREILMGNERERRNWLKVSTPNKYANGHCHHFLSRDLFFPLLFYFCFCFNRFKYSRRWGNIPAAALPNANKY